MTEQEAQTFAVRLTKIWGPMSHEPIWTLTDELFRFECRTEDHVLVTFEQSLQEPYKVIQFHPAWGNQHIPPQIDACRFYCSQFEQEVPSIDTDRVAIFDEHYLPLFRRKAWLSGFNIEATAHEKAEWIQGFSHEELEAWNLKM